MNIQPLGGGPGVSPQIRVSDGASRARRGDMAIIGKRMDGEGADQPGVSDIALAAQAAQCKRLPLAVEIAILLVIKLALLFAMARLCFAEPQAPHMRMDPAQVERRLLE